MPLRDRHHRLRTTRHIARTSLARAKSRSAWTSTSIPFLPGVREAVRGGLRQPTERSETRNICASSWSWKKGSDEDRAILFDPQTSGGLSSPASAERVRATIFHALRVRLSSAKSSNGEKLRSKFNETHGGGWGLVASVIFKITVTLLRRVGWVRFPHSPAIRLAARPAHRVCGARNVSAPSSAIAPEPGIAAPAQQAKPTASRHDAQASDDAATRIPDVATRSRLRADRIRP